MDNKVFDFESINKMKTQEYILFSEDKNLGVIALSKETFETIASITISEFKDVAYDEKSKRTAICKIKDNKLNINCEVALVYGAILNNITKIMQEKIYNNILEMTGFKADTINIKIIGFAVK